MPAISRIGDGHACGAKAQTGSPNVRANGIAIHRIGDSDADACHAGPIQSVGSPNVRANGIPVARVGDNCTAHKYLCPLAPHPANPHTSGSPNVFANGGG